MSNADEDALRAMRAASPALQEWWPDGKKPADKYGQAHDGESPRSWRGVKWSGDRVQALDFNGSKLEVLAPEIGQLQALTYFDLQDCLLKELPPEFGQLKALTMLRLEGCPLKELPPELGQLKALTMLILNNCPLVELPPEFGQLQEALTELYIDGCKQLLVLPPEFGQLLALVYLTLDGCEQLTLAPGAKEGQQAQTIVAAYARLLIVEPHKDTPGQLHAFLLANPLWVPAFFKFIIGDVTGDESLAEWLGDAVKATPELAHLINVDGRRATDIAEEAQLSRATAKPDE
eukprot:scaffold30971_cov51-Phaeocystis_antarctica.AAC.1